MIHNIGAKPLLRHCILITRLSRTISKPASFQPGNKFISLFGIDPTVLPPVSIEVSQVKPDSSWEYTVTSDGYLYFFNRRGNYKGRFRYTDLPPYNGYFPCTSTILSMFHPALPNTVIPATNWKKGC